MTKPLPEKSRPKIRRKDEARLRIARPPELLAKARHLYERTRTPVQEIWTLLDMDAPAFYRRVAHFGWVKRRNNPALQPPLSRTRIRRAQPRSDAPSVPLEIPVAAGCGTACTGLATCAARNDLLAQLMRCADRQALIINAAHRKFLALGGPPHQRQMEGHAWLLQELASARDTLRALDHIIRARVR